MKLELLSNDELLLGVRGLRGDERKLDRQIVEYVGEIETRRLYAEIGDPSVMEWLIKDLGYSESSAYRRAMAARAIRAVPEAAAKIEAGSLNLVALAKVQSAIRSEEKRTGERVSVAMRTEMIAETENKTLRETEQIVAKHFPEAAKLAGVQLSLTYDQLKELERVRELKSHSIFGASLSEIVAALAKDYLDRHDPLRREVKPRPSSKVSTPGNTTVEDRSFSKRTSIAPSTHNFVRRRADDRCEYLGQNGHRCGSRFQTQTDHILPIALGGKNSVENLRVLCRVHNSLMAEKILGKGRMRQFRSPS